jgi:hypothetical protein
VHPELGGTDNPPNGNIWLTLEENTKYAYIVGFLEGMFQGHCFTTWGMPGSEPNDPGYLHATKSYTDHWNQFVANVTYQQFFDGLNNFTPIIGIARLEFRIVISEISGQPGPSMESMIEAWRRKAAGED